MKTKNEIRDKTHVKYRGDDFVPQAFQSQDISRNWFKGAGDHKTGEGLNRVFYCF